MCNSSGSPAHLAVQERMNVYILLCSQQFACDSLLQVFAVGHRMYRKLEREGEYPYDFSRFLSIHW